jgi:putative endonuclease
MREPRHLETGKWGEKVAAKYLKVKGYKILGKRVRVGDRDEIDLIARDDKVLVFVEVKTRGGEAYGSPASAVDRHKRHVLSRAAVRYIKKLRNPRVYFRFDIVEVIGDMDADVSPDVRHIENAFPLDSRYSLP